MIRTRHLVLWAAGMAVAAANPTEGQAPKPADDGARRAAAATESRRHAIDALTRMADPKLDDWSTEKHAQASARQLAELASLLTKGRFDENELARLFAPTARTTDLLPADLVKTPLAGGLLVSRPRKDVSQSHGDVKPGPALNALLEPLVAAGAQRRVKFKIIGVTDVTPEGWSTEVRYEAVAQMNPAIVQQTARWLVKWSRAAAHDVVISGMSLLSFEQVAAPSPMFEDVTASVLGDDAALRLQLARGADYWYGRIDAVGEPYFWGHNGIAVGDVNGDGLDDVYVALGTGLPNKLFVQQPDGSAKDVAIDAGVAWLDDTKGVLLADMDNDGDQDLLCAMGPTIVLCKNNGHGKFTQFISMRAPTPASFYSLAVADYDLDGDLDIYGCRYVKLRYGESIPIPFHDANNGPTNHLMRNEGGDHYADMTFDVGLQVNNARFSLAATWADYDGDGDPDLYVANDFGRNNLYRNDGGKFTDVAAYAGAEDQAAGMGAAFADYDLDGDLDLYVSNMFSSAGRRIAYQPRFQADASAAQRGEIQRHSLGNTLLVNQGDGTYRDGSDAAGVRMGRWSWGSRFVDFNNDGFQDIAVPNGFLTNTLDDDL